MATPARGVGLLHPGEMGTAVAVELSRRDVTVRWASAGRSPDSVARAARAGLVDAGTVAGLVDGSDLVMSVCPPQVALDVARSVTGFEGLYVDANAVSPATVAAVAAIIEAGGGSCVDGGIVGPPPHRPGTTRLFLSGPRAQEVADLFAGTNLEPVLVGERIGAASAVKMAFAAWTKGTDALALAIRAFARAEGVDGPLVAEWERSVPELPPRSAKAAANAAAKGWRWGSEMDEIAAAFGAQGQPEGFHRAAAEVFRQVPRTDVDGPAGALDLVLGLLTQGSPGPPAGPVSPAPTARGSADGSN